MAQRPIEYQRPMPRPTTAWHQSDLVAAAVTAFVIVIANGILLWVANQSDAGLLWIFIFDPIANGALAAVLIACSPIVRALSGVSAALHVWVAVVGCVAASVVDAYAIVQWLPSC